MKIKFLLFIAGAFALFSCGENTSSESATEGNFDFSYTIDTVLVDNKGQIINLNLALGNSFGVSPDTKSPPLSVDCEQSARYNL